MKKTEMIREALRRMYGKKGYFLYEEVKRATGYIKPERFADAIAISLFPSGGGITLSGFEIKTVRADLLSELRDLSKSEAIKQFCDYWILIVGDDDILNGKVKVPDDWGVWVFYNNVDGGCFHVKQKAKRLYPKPPDRYFLASLLRQNNTAIEKD